MWPFARCAHYDTRTTFKYLHRGGDGELYLVADIHCANCKWKRALAIRLPDILTDVIDEKLWAGTLSRKEL